MSKLDHSRPILRLIDNEKQVAAEEAARGKRRGDDSQKTIKQDFLDVVQHRLLAIAARWKETGDVRPAVRSTNEILDEFCSDLSADDLAPWLAKYFGFSLDPVRGTFVHGSRKAKTIDLREVRSSKWWSGRESSQTLHAGLSSRRERRSRRHAIQSSLEQIAGRWKETGDIRPAVSSVENLLTEHPDLLRESEAFRSWVRRHLGFLYNAETGRFAKGKKRAADIDVAHLRTEKWWVDP